MKDILKHMNQSSNMDFCEILSNIQSILNYANEHIQPFARIQFRGGRNNAHNFSYKINTKLFNSSFCILFCRQ